MSDIFRYLCQDIIDEKFFGICDDDNVNGRAYLDANDAHKWLGTVQNRSGKEITFTALDKCIELRNPDGTISKRCEGILTFDETIIFVEAKDRGGDEGKWARDADKQLRATIKNIERRIDLSQFQSKRAAIVNRQRVNQSHIIRIKQFLDDTGYTLSVDKRITIDN